MNRKISYILEVYWLNGGGFEEEYKNMESLKERIESMSTNEQTSYMYKVFKKELIEEIIVVRKESEEE